MKFDKDKGELVGVKAKNLDEAMEGLKERSEFLYRHTNGMTNEQWRAVVDIYYLLRCITIGNDKED